jgi:hypothetical protein
MKKHAFAIAAALTLVLAAGSGQAAGKVDGASDPFRSGGESLGALPNDQFSLNWAFVGTSDVYHEFRNIPGGYEGLASLFTVPAWCRTSCYYK